MRNALARCATEARRTMISAVALFILFLAPALLAADGTAKGTLTVAGKAIPLTHAYALAQKGFFDAKSDDILVLLSDVPLTDAALTDPFERQKLEKAGKLHSVEAVIDAKKQPINVTVRHSAFKMTASGGSTEDLFDATTFDGKSAAGRLHRKSPGTSFDDVPYTYDVTFSAPIAPRKK
jgi:hypothetical protein